MIEKTDIRVDKVAAEPEPLDAGNDPTVAEVGLVLIFLGFLAILGLGLLELLAG